MTMSSGINIGEMHALRCFEMHEMQILNRLSDASSNKLVPYRSPHRRRKPVCGFLHKVFKAIKQHARVSGQTPY